MQLFCQVILCTTQNHVYNSSHEAVMFFLKNGIFIQYILHVC